MVWVPGWDRTKREKLLLLSLTLFNYVYVHIYLCIVKNKILLNACMNQNGMCVFVEGKLLMLEWLIPCLGMDMNELMCLLGKA